MKKIKNIGIINFGAGNLYAIKNACHKIGLKTKIVNENLDNYDALIIPGVGAFKTAIENIKLKNYYDKINEFKKTGKLILGICLGMQLLASKSFEDGENDGFCFVDANVSSVKDDLSYINNKNDKIITPITGWNSVFFNTNNKDFKFSKIDNFNSENFYFIHSYWIKNINKKYLLGTAYFMNHNYCACFKKENVIGTQFHPERSGNKGLNLLEDIFINNDY